MNINGTEASNQQSKILDTTKFFFSITWIVENISTKNMRNK
jgi:hypothetical protein